MGRLPRGALGVLLALCALVVGAAWSFASPPVSSPDEDYHLGSIWCPPPAEAAGCRTAVVDGKPAVYVPAVLAQRPCYVGHLDQSAACQDEHADTDLVPSTRVDTGDYPGPYYWAMHALVGPSVSRSVLAMRLVNVAIAVGLVGAALALAPPHPRRAATYALLIGLVPLGVFITASVNPSSWAFVGLTALWIALNSLAQVSGNRVRAANAAVAVAGAVLASVARGDSGPFIAIIVTALAVLHLRRRLDPLWLATAGLAIAAGVWSFLSSGQSSGVAPTETEGIKEFWWVLGHDLTEILQVPAGVLGVGPWGTLGWVEVPLPTTVFVPLVALAGFVVVRGLADLDVRKTIALGLVGGALLALPFYMLMRNLDTAGIQPRYFLSQVPFLLALCALLPGARTAFRLSRAQGVLAWVGVTVAHAVTLLTALRRYTTGLAGSYQPGEDATWWWGAGPSPLVWWLAGSVAYGLAALALVVTAGRDAPAATVGHHE